MPEALQQEAVGSSRVARPPVELSVAVKERYELLQIKDGGLANGDGSHGRKDEGGMDRQPLGMMFMRHGV